MEYDYSKLFQPLVINKMTVRNRISMSPMGTFMVHDIPSEEAMRYYEERAKGGVGLLICGASYPNEMLSQGLPRFAVDKMDAIPAATVFTERIHRWGAKVALQVGCGTGRNANIFYDEIPVCASAVPSFHKPDVICLPLTIEEIKQTVETWKDVGNFAVKAGFDAVEIHAHVGYLIDQFMSPQWNQRTDEYGGSFENRCRFAIEIIEAIRSVTGPDFPILYRISLDHMFEGGRTLEDSIEILKVLDRAGIDAFDVDSGSYEALDYVFPTRYNGDACTAYVCETARKALTKPILNAGSHTMETAIELLDSGNADMIQFGRQFIADPQWPNKLKKGKRSEIRPCILCNDECIGRILDRQTQLSCTVNPATGFETHMELTRLEEPTSVVVIGGGPGGMEAARCAAERGCSVTLYEKEDHLGGTFKTIATGDFKRRMRELVQWYEFQLKKLGVKVVLNAELDPDDAVFRAADAIFVATGSKPIIPDLPGLDSEKFIDVFDVHKNGLPAGKNVVICGGGMSACDTAIEYGEAGDRNITIVEMMPTIGADVQFINAMTVERLLKQYKVTQLVNTKVVGMNDEGVVVESGGEQKVLPADVVVGAFGRARNLDYPNAIRYKYPTKTVVIGDCEKPGKAGGAIRDGFYAAMGLQ